MINVRGLVMQILCSDFSEGDTIPARFTCDGSDANPALSFVDVPDKAKSLVLIIDDPDSKSGSANPGWVHWILYNIDPSNTELAEDYSPEEARAGINDWGKAEYGGPCPAVGKHRYVHSLYALDTELDFPMPPTKSELMAAARGHILATASLMGVYERA